MALEDCSKCGSKSDIAAFDLQSGGFLCRKHTENKPSVINVSGELWGTLRFLAQCNYSAAPRMNVNSTTGRRIETLFKQYYLYHIPGLKTPESWKKLQEIYWVREE